MIYLNNRRAAHAWISQTTITAGQLHIATRDGEVMFFHDSIDFSPYAGTDAGSTPYRLVFVDFAGKQAVAYGGAVGGGEALGAELIPTIDFTDSGLWTLTNCSAVDADTVIHDVDSISVFIIPSYNMFMVIGKLYKGQSSFSLSLGASNGLAGNGDAPIYCSSSGDVKYGTALNKYLRYYWRVLTSLDNATFDLSSITLKEVTDVPATGLHLMSAKNGTTRNMTLVETGFKPNTVVKVRIYA